MEFNGMKLFLVRYYVDVSPHMGDPTTGEYSRIVFAANCEEAEQKIEDLYPSEDYSVYRCVRFIDTAEAIM